MSNCNLAHLFMTCKESFDVNRPAKMSGAFTSTLARCCIGRMSDESQLAPHPRLSVIESEKNIGRDMSH